MSNWTNIKKEIIDNLDIPTEYELLGIAMGPVNSGGWCPVKGDNSAQVNASSGVLHDFSEAKSDRSFWNIAEEHGDFADWYGCIKHYADKAGVKLPAYVDPAKDLEFRDDSQALKVWCSRKGIDPAIAGAEGIRTATYKGKHQVVVVPIYNDSSVDPVGYAVARVDGRPVYKRVKVQTTKGSQGGVFGKYTFNRIRDAKKYEDQHAIKCEGLTDWLACQSMIPGDKDETHFAFSNSFGCSETPADWILQDLAGATILVVGDADQPGQAGALKWGGALAHRSTVQNVRLPFNVADKKGKDLCDFFGDGHSFDDFLALQTEEVKPAEEEDCTENEPLRNFVWVDTEDNEKPTRKPRPIIDIVDDLLGRTKGFPKACNGVLFFRDRQDRIVECQKPEELFGMLQATLGIVEWSSGTGFPTKAELFSVLPNYVEAYDAVEKLPHWPPLPNVYYLGGGIFEGDGKALEGLLDYFCLETTEDRELLKCAFASPLWGGPAGSRPAFFFTAADGQGSGKTQCAEAIGKLYGGRLEISQTADIDKIKTRVLSPDSRGVRVVLLDNLKSSGFSWADFEALISSTTISGHRLYAGEGQRRNHFTFLITGNGASLSTDVSQRTVEIHMRRPEYRGDWLESLNGYIERHRGPILNDLCAFLQSPPKSMSSFSRWSSWEKDVLSKCENPGRLLEIIKSRRTESDVEEDLAGNLEETFARHLERLGYDTDKEWILIPSHVVNRWYCEASAERVAMKRSTQAIKQLCSSGRLEHIAYKRTNTSRGFLWVGEGSDTSNPVRDDLLVQAERFNFRFGHE